MRPNRAPVPTVLIFSALLLVEAAPSFAQSAQELNGIYELANGRRTQLLVEAVPASDGEAIAVVIEGQDIEAFRASSSAPFVYNQGNCTVYFTPRVADGAQTIVMASTGTCTGDNAVLANRGTFVRSDQARVRAPAPQQQPPPQRRPTEAASQDPRLDCDRPASASERTICSDSVLTRHEQTIERLYGTVLRLSPQPELARISQREWIATRNRCGTNVACLRRSYRDRIAILRDEAAAVRQLSRQRPAPRSAVPPARAPSARQIERPPAPQIAQPPRAPSEPPARASAAAPRQVAPVPPVRQVAPLPPPPQKPEARLTAPEVAKPAAPEAKPATPEVVKPAQPQAKPIAPETAKPAIPEAKSDTRDIARAVTPEAKPATPEVAKPAQPALPQVAKAAQPEAKPAMPEAKPAAPVQAKVAAVIPAKGGPDIFGVQIGMTFAEAEKIIRANIDVGMVLVADRRWQTRAAPGAIEPYTSGRLFLSRDEKQVVIIYDEPPAAPEIVFGVVRQVRFAKEAATAADLQKTLRQELEKKYGEKAKWTNNGYHNLAVWTDTMTDSPTGNHVAAQCVRVWEKSRKDIWRTADGKPVDPSIVKSRDRLDFPSLDDAAGAFTTETINSPRPNGCKGGVAAVVSVDQDWPDFDTWLYDKIAYGKAFLSSKELLGKAPASAGAGAATSTDTGSAAKKSGIGIKF